MRKFFLVLWFLFCFNFCFCQKRGAAGRNHGRGRTRFTQTDFVDDDSFWTGAQSDSTRAASTSSSITNQQQCECPAVEPIDYDPRYQAYTLEEAVINFPDLTNPTSEFLESLSSPTPPPTNPATESPTGNRRWRSRSKCDPSSDECKTCASQLLDKVQESGLVDSDKKRRIAQEIGVDDIPTGSDRNRRRRCNRYRFSKNIRKFTEGELSIPTSLDDFVRNGSSYFADIQRKRRQRGERSRRTKRETVKSSEITGSSYDLSCVKRGEPETEDENSWAVTCNMCWSWRVLPEDYSPRYINELRCDEGTQCLAGYGECQQRVKTVAVTYKGQKVDVAANICCDCKVQLGSQLHGFVSK